MIDVRFRLFKGCLLQHWQFFMGNPRTNKKPNQNGQQFFESSMMEILKTFHSAGFGLAGNSNSNGPSSNGTNGTNGTGGGMMVVSPERVRYNLKTLKQLHRVHKLFASCSSELRVQCLTVCLNMIANTSMELLRDDIVPLIHSIASFNFDDFFKIFLPQYVSSVLGSISNFHQQKLCVQFGNDCDAVSFKENSINFANYMQTLMTN